MAELNELVNRICAKQKNNDDAVEEIRSNITKDMKEGLLLMGIRGMVQGSRHREKTQIKLPIPKAQACSRGLSAISAAGKVIEKSLLKSWLFADGRCLAQLTGEEARAEAENEKATGNGHIKNAEFFNMLADRTPAKKKIGKCIGDKLARKLWNKIISPSHVKIVNQSHG